MLIRVLLFFMGFTISLVLSAQNMDVLQTDQLKTKLASSRMDTMRALTLGQLAEAYRDRDRDSSLMYANEALALSRQLGFIPGTVKSTLSISYISYSRGDLTRALDLGLQALDMAKKHGLQCLSYDIITKWQGGSLTCDTKPNEYTKFTITLPSDAS